MIIWSGWGILVPLYVVVAFGLSIVGVSAIGLAEGWEAAVGFTVAGLLAGVAIFFTARALDAREGRVLLDEKTGQRVLLKPSAGSFFFIPTRFWAFIAPAVGVLFGAVMAMGAATGGA